MSEILTTYVKVANVEQLVELAGDIDGTTAKDALVGIYPFLENCAYVETVEGDTRTIVFAEQMGTKGCAL